MSIATQITRLQNIKAAIRQALVNKGVTSASTHDMDDFATDIGSIPTGGTYQSKTVSPSTSQQTVTPDSGYDALSQVTVNAARKQSKTVNPSTSSQTVSPDSGYYGLSQVTVNAIGNLKFRKIFISSSKLSSTTQTFTVSEPVKLMTVMILSGSNEDYSMTSSCIGTMGGWNRSYIYGMGIHLSIDDYDIIPIRYRFVNAMDEDLNTNVQISYDGTSYTITFSVLPPENYRPYFHIYQIEI